MSEPFGSLRLEHSSTVDRVADELRRAVFDGELESGTPLREVALAESLGVSRPTIREALAVLVVEGLATREPNRGVSIATPDPDSVRDVCQARTVLEVAGVRHWPTAGEELREEVRGALAAYQSRRRRAAVLPGAQRAAPRHPPVPGRPHRLAAAGRDGRGAQRRAPARAGPGRPGPPNAHAQVGSHTHLLRLLENGEIDAAAADLAEHLASAEVAIIDRLHLNDGD